MSIIADLNPYHPGTRDRDQARDLCDLIVATGDNRMFAELMIAKALSRARHEAVDATHIVQQLAQAAMEK